MCECGMSLGKWTNVSPEIGCLARGIRVSS